jgi:hypothetical protein
MPLTWKLNGIEDYKEKCFFVPDEGPDKGKTKLEPRTEILIFMTITVGLNEITKKNIDEWEIRVEMLKKCDRSMGVIPSEETGELEDWWPSRKDLEDHIGLWVNTFPAKTRAQFRTMTMKGVERDVLDEMRRRKAKEEAA